MNQHEIIFLYNKKTTKTSLYTPPKKELFKSKLKEIIKILYDSKIKKDRKIEEI